MTMQIAVFLVGLITGCVVYYFYERRRLAEKKRAMRARKRSRQRSIHERFRIEVKNNTIRIKKEQKRLALTKQAAPIELLFKNYKRRLHKIADRDLMEVLQDYYNDLIALLSMNNTFIAMIGKKIQQNQHLDEQATVDLYDYITSTLLQGMAQVEEKGAGIVSVLEDKIQNV